MLTQIHIRDLATIEELHLTLDRGTAMITGETGAGKSIFIEAIELALGGRAQQNIIRPGKDKADISLCFDITHFPRVIACLESLDLYQNNNECIIRRTIISDGRSRCYVNGTPTTVNLLKELGELLFHIHGQHEQQVLLKQETQRDMLDRYADHLSLAATVKTFAEEWKSVTQEIEGLLGKDNERTHKIEFLRFQIEELQTLNLKAGEWDTLEAEHLKLTHAEEIRRHLRKAASLLGAEEEHTVLALLNTVRKTFEAIQSFEPKAAQWMATVNTALIQLADLASELDDTLIDIDLDSSNLQLIETRVGQIFDLARKHKIQPNDLLAFRERLENELSLLSAFDETLAQLKTRQKQLALKYTEQAHVLSEKRQKAASKLEREINATIRSLSLPHGEFKISFENEATPMALNGHEKIVFLIKTNPDQSLQPLSKVISGGELSRLSLALHLALAARTTIPTLVFDEVDTGLSGATAEKIGRLLRKLGESYQVFCVTHQAQVAALGHHHVLVEKYFIEKTTYTRLRMLLPDEKTQEIARMLGGEKITQRTLDHAKEILALS